MSAVTRKTDGSGLIVTVRLTLNFGRDDDLIALVQRAPSRRLAAVIRNAMRGGVSVETASAEEEDILDLSGLGKEL